MARPTDYTQNIADAICEKLSDGSSLRDICLAEDMPNRATVFRWLNKHQEFSDQYARAREEQAETMADEIIGIVDSAGNPLTINVDGADIPLLKDGEAVMYADAPSVAHARLKMDARKWVASKLKPKKYGDKVEVEAKLDHSGEVKHTVGFDTSALDLLNKIRASQ